MKLYVIKAMGIDTRLGFVANYALSVAGMPWTPALNKAELFACRNHAQRVANDVPESCLVRMVNLSVGDTDD